LCHTKAGAKPAIELDGVASQGIDQALLPHLAEHEKVIGMNPFNATALVIIDLQRGILKGMGGKRRKETEEALEATTQRISELLGKTRRAGVPVLYVQHDGGPGNALEPHSPGWEIREEIAPAAGELVIRKRACDAFFETELAAELSRLQIRRIVVAGCMTEYCIDTTVRRAVSLGYDVVLAADGHMSADSGGLRFEQIIEHHNSLLDGFKAGKHSVSVMPISEIAVTLRE
jgi:nicotinamidase-related amidase